MVSPTGLPIVGNLLQVLPLNSLPVAGQLLAMLPRI